tara:strand:+ start:291 stop:1211 length:921 start_codon:yes stop_codon:yes gene_type:complete
MNLVPSNQKILHGFNNEFKELVALYKKKKLPQKILLSGQKGSGKCTLAYHLTNFILSEDEDFEYDLKNYTINDNNRSYRLIQNKSNPNFRLIDVILEKKTIDILQIKDLILSLQKSSFNSKPRIILIDNIEYLNHNSINALLKILEEPLGNTFFMLIHNNKRILPTLKSRCLNFKLNLTNKSSIDISSKILNENIFDLINQDLLDYYITPGKIYKLVAFARTAKINLKKINLTDFLNIIIDETYYKKDISINYMIYDFIELYLIKNISPKYYSLLDIFKRKIDDVKRFNLDQESFFLEFKLKFLNG